MENIYNTIEEALEDLKKGKIIIVTDDEDRENEGDLICAAEFATTENINFMSTLFYKKEGDKVNIENDIIGKYVEKLLTFNNCNNEKNNKNSNINMEFLIKNGF